MKNRNLSKEELIEQLKELSNSKNLVTEKYSPNQKNSTLLSYKRGADGRVYGIIKENNKYFIKVASGKKKDLTVFDFAYIGGLSNILQEKYNSFSDASKRFNLKMLSLNEAFGHVDENDIPLNKDIDKEKIVSEPEISSDTEESSSENASEVSTDVENIESDDVDTEMSSTEEIVDDNESSESSDEGGETEDDVTKEIQSLLGKLTQKFNELGDVDSQMAKNAINTVISATKTGIEQFDDDDKEKIIKRIEKGGEKIEENRLNEQKLTKVLSKIIKEEKQNIIFEEMEMELDNLSEDDLINEIGNEYLDELYEDSWVNETITKLNELALTSESLAKKFIKEKYSKQCNELMSEDYDMLDEASIKDLFSKVGLTKAYDKAKNFFTKKNVEKFVESNPTIKDNVEDGIEALESNDKNKWLSFKQKVGRGLAMYLLIFKLLSIASPLMAQEENKLSQSDVLDATKKIEMVAKGGGNDLTGGGDGDDDVKADETPGESLKNFITSDELKNYKVKGTGSHTVKIQFPGGQGADVETDVETKVFKEPPIVAKYTNINIDDTNVDKDSKELGKKYKWIADKMSKFDSDPDKFDEQFDDLKDEFKDRFADTELRMMNGKVVFDHKFVDNDNFAQADYKTDKGEIIKKGQKIPQNTKVVSFFAGDVENEKGKTSTPTLDDPYEKDYSELSASSKNIAKSSLAKTPQERDGVAKKLANDLSKYGLKTQIKGENLIVDPNSSVWVDSSDVDGAVEKINSEIEKIGKKYGVDLSNMFKVSKNVDIKAGKLK